MSMRGARPLHPARWLGIPLLTCVGATIVFAAPIRIWGLQLPEPVFAMVPAFAWALIRPSILAPFALLLLGLFLDLFWGTPFGLWGVSLLVVYSAALMGRSLIAGQAPQAKASTIGKMGSGNGRPKMRIGAAKARVAATATSIGRPIHSCAWRCWEGLPISCRRRRPGRRRPGRQTAPAAAPR